MPVVEGVGEQICFAVDGFLFEQEVMIYQPNILGCCQGTSFELQHWGTHIKDYTYIYTPTIVT